MAPWLGVIEAWGASNATALISFFVSFLALVVAYWTARIQNRTSVTALFLDFSRRYNSSEMREAMLSLTGFFLSNQGPDFATLWFKDFNAGSEAARLLDNQRRLINRYYSDLIRLYRHRYVDRAFIRLAGEHYAINVYYKVVHPMNQVMFSGELQILEFAQDRRELSKIVRAFGNGRLTGEQAGRG